MDWGRTRRKRHESPLDEDEEEEEKLKPPKRKQRLTEDKMAARLRNFHITAAANGSRNDRNWFFMRRPEETLRDIEDRLSDDEVEDSSTDEDSLESHQTPSTSAPPKLTMDPNLKRYIEAKNSSFSPWLQTPESTMAVVLWKPSDSFVDNILQTNSEQAERKKPVTNGHTKKDRPPYPTVNGWSKYGSPSMMHSSLQHSFETQKRVDSPLTRLAEQSMQQEQMDKRLGLNGTCGEEPFPGGWIMEPEPVITFPSDDESSPSPSPQRAFPPPPSHCPLIREISEHELQLHLHDPSEEDMEF